MKKMFIRNMKSAGMLACAAFLVASCSKDPQSPGYEYMPDMYRSVPYDAYSKNPFFSNGTTAQQPVEGTMSYQSDRTKMLNIMPYPYANTPEGYEAAGLYLTNPLPTTEQNIKDGETLFKNFCKQCHGEKGMGDGIVGTKNPALIPPAYNSDQLKDLPQGKIFHSITWGKGMMGAHQYQINKTDRWKLVQYVQSLQKTAAPSADAAKSDSTKNDTKSKPADKMPKKS